MNQASAIEALEALRERTGRQLKLRGRCESGESGAFRVEDEDGQPFVLNLGPEGRLRKATATTTQLRSVGYPAPTCVQTCAVTADTWCCLMEILPGEPLERLEPDIAVQLLGLIELQAGQALMQFEPESVLDTLLHGGHGYALHETMRRYSKDTRELLEYVVEVGKAASHLLIPTADIAHFDLNPTNILGHDGRVTGIVDWEGTRAGDRAFDIATLLFYADDPETESILCTALLNIGGLERARVYLAHMMLRQVEWSARFHTEAEIRRYVARSRELRALLESES